MPKKEILSSDLNSHEYIFPFSEKMGKRAMQLSFLLMFLEVAKDVFPEIRSWYPVLFNHVGNTIFTYSMVFLPTLLLRTVFLQVRKSFKNNDFLYDENITQLCEEIISLYFPSFLLLIALLINFDIETVQLLPIIETFQGEQNLKDLFSALIAIVGVSYYVGVQQRDHLKSEIYSQNIEREKNKL